MILALLYGGVATGRSCQLSCEEFSKTQEMVTLKQAQYFYGSPTFFYPPKEDTQNLIRGPIDTLSIYWVSKSLEHFKNL